jgi:hypothetical protein
MAAADKRTDKGTLEFVAGGALGAAACAEAAVGVAVCPLCVIAAPVLIAVGVYKKLYRGKKPIVG